MCRTSAGTCEVVISLVCCVFEGAQMDRLKHNIPFRVQILMSASLVSTTVRTSAPTRREDSLATAVRGTPWMRADHSAKVSPTSALCMFVQQVSVFD